MKLLILATILLLIPNIALADSEKELIQSHLQLVEEGLRSTDVSHLSPSQRNARKQNLDNLRKYWQAGIFPENTKHPNQRVPYFIDDGGRVCAMAHLLIESGHKEAALQIQLRENNAYVHDIKSPELSTWLKTNGLTLDEAAWIQPTYQRKCDCQCNISPVQVQVNKSSYINECIAVRCYNIPSVYLKQGCYERTREVKMTITRWMDKSDPCYELKNQGLSASQICNMPSSEITGEFDSQTKMDMYSEMSMHMDMSDMNDMVVTSDEPSQNETGCSTTTNTIPNNLWWWVLLICFGARRRDSLTG